MNTKLITALRTAAKALEAGTFIYKWGKASSCNCGVVICAIKGVAPAQLPVPGLKKEATGTWVEMAGYHCPITGIPTHALFKELFSYGLTQVEIKDLEYLSNEKVLAKLGVEKLRHNNQEDLIKYLYAWANLLVEEGQMDGKAGPTVEPMPETKPLSFLERIFS